MHLGSFLALLTQGSLGFFVSYGFARSPSAVVWVFPVDFHSRFLPRVLLCNLLMACVPLLVGHCWPLLWVFVVGLFGGVCRGVAGLPPLYLSGAGVEVRVPPCAT